MLVNAQKGKNNTKIMLITYAVLSAALALVIIFKELVSPFILAFLLAYIMSPVVNYFERKNFNRLFVTISIFVLFAVIVFFFVNIFIDAIGDEVSAIQKKLPVITEKVNTSIDNITGLFPSTGKTVLQKRIVPKLTGITEVTGEYLITTFSTLMNWFGGVLGGITSAFVLLFIAFFLLKDWNKISTGFLKAFPVQYSILAKKLLAPVNVQIGRYIRGQLLVAASVGIIATGGLLLFGFEYAYLLGAVAGITNLVPLLGPISAIIVGLIVSVFSPQPYLICAIKVISVLTVVQIIDEVLISPIIIGKSVKIHPITVITTIYFGGYFMGIIGMLIAIPVYVLLKSILTEVHFGLFKKT
ncbi:MAG: hypothetical protein A2452_10810 [Candidatus Firestonebacteria bacterium RIFOXYC2_FULL_39_67]|nr:MAG: hypothetical protein A2536_08710 [Candidatus Firestonebacteria bacterium RIFOXYD2_FULL_39_29]OGF55946.1 MAG: hypothetical protein A2452_10810 [Candidatus Firestonebacteria bacterium RIFOXYC2_FULL_39_67]